MKKRNIWQNNNNNNKNRNTNSQNKTKQKEQTNKNPTNNKVKKEQLEQTRFVRFTRTESRSWQTNAHNSKNELWLVLRQTA